METFSCTSSPYSSPSSSSSSSSSSSIMSCFTGEKARELCCFAISKFITKLLYAIAIFIFTVAGATFGAILGATVGIRTNTGCLYGATVGAIKCSLLLPRLFTLSLSLWRTSDDIEIRHLLQRVAAFYPRNNAESRIKVAGFSMMASLRRIQEIGITEENILDSSRNRISCSICLQDFSVGENAKCLPQCQHLFHPACIDRWLIGKRSCPLCRRNL
ncbi:hypothetical protein SLE2022_217600 [Rubroshorea leprosula]